LERLDAIADAVEMLAAGAIGILHALILTINM
jgi:hypothetical protein